MPEYRGESEIYNYQWIQLSNNKFINSDINSLSLTGPWLSAMIIIFKLVENETFKTSEFAIYSPNLGHG